MYASSGAQGAGVQQQPGSVWRAQHPDLPGDGLPPPGDYHRPAEEWRDHHHGKSDRFVLRQDLALPPVQICRVLSQSRGRLCVRRQTRGQKNRAWLG